jgi:hypothetical protein
MMCVQQVSGKWQGGGLIPWNIPRSSLRGIFIDADLEIFLYNDWE